MLMVERMLEFSNLLQVQLLLLLCVQDGNTPMDISSSQEIQYLLKAYGGER